MTLEDDEHLKNEHLSKEGSLSKMRALQQNLARV